MQVLGIDIGGSGVKGAIVDSTSGELLSDRFRLSTPKPASPENLVKTITQLVAHFDWRGKVACGFPTPFHNGKCITGGNLHKKWKGVHVADFFKKEIGNDFTVVNDADAAGLAEIYFGAGKDVSGTVIMVTLGTGIGSAVFLDGKLLPNTEFGHVYTDKGIVFEKYAADSIRKKENLSRRDWGKRLNKYFQHIEMLLSPNIIIIGGGASKKLEKFVDQIKITAPIVAATAQNEAGIIGAALAASNQQL
jgi:polyphosphate glucokinase